jgi:uncharacterized protein YuzE
MKVHYDSKKDLLYLRLIEGSHDVINKRVADDVTLDMGAHDQIIGIEILDASTHLDLKSLLPVEYDVSS